MRELAVVHEVGVDGDVRGVLGRPPNRLRRPRRASMRRPCSWAVPDAAAVMTTSAPRPPVASSTAATGSWASVATVRSGWTSAAAGGEPVGVQIDQDDAGGPAGPCEPHVQAADRPGADDDDGVALPHPRELLAVEHARERLGQRRLGEAQVLGDALDAVDRSTSRGTIRYSANPPRELVAHRQLVRADRLVPGEAVRAGAVGDRGDDLHAVPDGPAVYPVADVDDLAGDLVAHDLWRGHVRVPGPRDLHVGAAGRAGADAQLDLARCDIRLGDLLEPDVARCVVRGCFHPATTRRPRPRRAARTPGRRWWLPEGLPPCPGPAGRSPELGQERDVATPSFGPP